jgi:heterodisulfide reductase subunit A-like polyferredoxin
MIRMSMAVALAAAPAAASAVIHNSGPGAPEFDVVVYGASCAGVAAAVAAGQLGMTVGLYEPLPMIGGMCAAGNLALHDSGPAGCDLASHTQCMGSLSPLSSLPFKIPGVV